MKLFQEADRTRSLMSKPEASFFGHVMRREKFEHLVTIRMIEGKLHEKMLDGVTNWLKVG